MSIWYQVHADYQHAARILHFHNAQKHILIYMHKGIYSIRHEPTINSDAESIALTEKLSYLLTGMALMKDQQYFPEKKKQYDI